MSWDHKVVLQLIDDYKQEPILWDPKHKLHYHTPKKDNAWQNIAEKNQMSLEDVKLKINRLKGTLRKEKSRIKNKTGKGQRDVSRWFAYDAMSFLLDRDDPSSTISNFESDDGASELEDVHDAPDTDEDSPQLTEDLEETTVLSKPQTSRETKQFKLSAKPKRKRSKRSEENALMEKAYEYLKKSVSSTKRTRDECSIFGDHVANKLRSLRNDWLRAKAQHKISTILFDLEMSQYNTPTNSETLHTPNHYDNDEEIYGPHSDNPLVPNNSDGILPWSAGHSNGLHTVIEPADLHQSPISPKIEISSFESLTDWAPASPPSLSAMPTSNSETEEIPPEITATAKVSVEADNLLPPKSSVVYEAAFKRFMTWCSQKDISIYSEGVLLTYFSEMAKRVKSSSLWAHYSMIRALLKLRQDVDITKYFKLRAFLKKQNEGYSPKKSRVLTKEEFDRFIFKAPDEKYLATKVLLIFGISGSCRCDELYKIKLDSIEEHGSILLVKVPDSKTNKIRSFTVVGEPYVDKYRKYVSQRPEGYEEKRLFIKYQNGKCCRMVMGYHKIGKAGKEAATYLKLPEANEYTGRCLRRTSATLFANTDADVTTLKRHGVCESNSVVEEEPLERQMYISRNLLPSTSNSRTSTENDVLGELDSKDIVNISNLEEMGENRLVEDPTNCTLNVNINNYYEN